MELKTYKKKGIFQRTGKRLSLVTYLKHHQVQHLYLQKRNIMKAALYLG